MEAQRNPADSHERAPVTARSGHRLELEGQLELVADSGQRIALSAEGSRVRLEIGNVSRRRATLKLMRSSVVLARRLSNVLHDRSLTLTVTRDGEPLIELGRDVTGGFLARLFGMSRVKVYGRGRPRASGNANA